MMVVGARRHLRMVVVGAHRRLRTVVVGAHSWWWGAGCHKE